MKHVFLTLVFIAPLVAGASTALEKLDLEIRSETTFRQVTSEPRCPSSFITVYTENGPRIAERGDVSTWFKPTNNSTYFVHEEGRIFFRPGLPTGVEHIINQSLVVVRGREDALGVFKRTFKQMEKDGILYTEFTVDLNGSRISTKRVTYDSNKSIIQTHMSGPDIEDVDCEFEKASN